MTMPEVVSRTDWLAARRVLLAKEKDHTRAQDALSAERRELPRLLVDKDYQFETTDGQKLSLPELFDGRKQLVIFHMMPPHTSGGIVCTGCSFWIDNMPQLGHLHARDTSLVVDWPEPIAEIIPHKDRMGWTVPVVSSSGTDFYSDFSFPLDSDEPQMPGISAFLREGDTVYCTYTTRLRGSEWVNTTYHYLDLTALGRQESEYDFPMEWLRYHDEYEN